MPRSLLTLAVFALLFGLDSPAFAQKCLHEGFQVELIYAPPDIEHPSVVACDDEGNLYVGEDPMDMRGPTTKHFDRIILIRWDQETGKPIRTVFAENLAAVFGLIWHDGALYVMHAPLYSVLRDTNGDGVADERKDLASGFGPPAGVYGFNDHIVTGTRLGMDGFVYISVGDKGVPKATGADGSTISLEGGGVVRMRLDGTRLEVVTSGTRNHLDVAMDSLDNIFTYDNTDDGLGWWTRFTHHVPSGYYGYPYDYHPHPERHLPRISEHGGGSPVGAACYREAAWPAKYRDAAFHCEWGKGKVQVFYPKRKGATFEATMEDFLVKEGSEEFRPLDLCFSPDGKHMYLADWNFGGWVNPKVCGRLWRVTYTGPGNEAKAIRSADDLVQRDLAALGDASHSARMKAQWELAKRAKSVAGDPVVAGIGAILNKKDAPKFSQIHAIWTANEIAERNTDFAPLPLFDDGLKSVDAEVRAQAARAIGNRKLKEGAPALAAALKDEDASVRMHAAIGLGRLAPPAGYSLPLYTALADDDVFVRHTAQQALRQINDWKEAKAYLDSDNEIQRQATVVALTNRYHDDAVAALAWAVEKAKYPDVRIAALSALAEVHRQADPYEKGWWGTQPAKGKPARSKKHDWSGTSLVLTTVRESLRSPDEKLRKAAMKAVAEVKDPQALPILAAIALDEKQAEDVRGDSLTTLVSNKASQAATVARQLVADEKATGPLVVAALAAITATKSVDAIDVVQKRLASEQVEVRSKALEALAAIAGREATPHLVQALRDLNDDVRKTAIRVTGEAKLVEAIPVLIEVAAQNDVQQEATLALAAMPDRRSLGALLTGLASKNNTLRDTCRAALVSIKDQIGEDIVDRHKANELTPEMRRQLQGVFAGPAAIRKWQLAGAFPKDKGQPKFDPTAAPDLNQTWPIGEKMAKWQPAESNDPTGRIGPGSFFKDHGEVWSLGYAAVEVDADQQVEFLLGSDDQAKLFVNGQKVHEFGGNRGWSAEQDRGHVKLTKGVNHVYFLCGNTSGPWDFSLALRLPNSQYAFLFENTPPQLDPAAYRDFAIKNKGDSARGKQIFFDLKGVACAKCHALAGVGAKVGPDMVGIGAKYPREELIRSVLEPSARVADSYAMTIVRTSEGQTVQGVVKNDNEQTLELITAEGKR